MLTFSMVAMALFLVAGCHPSGGTPATYTVSGTVGVSNNIFTDSDINDVYATDYMSSNDDFTSRQLIANPAIVGGYVNSPNTGATGNSNSNNKNGDVADYFLVTLNSGDKVNLYIADASQSLDLYLYSISDTLTPVASSVDADTAVNIAQVHSVSAPSAGDYYIVVSPNITGQYASNYTLAVGISSITAVEANFTADDFAPGEILVQFKENAKPAVGIQTSTTITERLGLQVKSGSPDRVMVLGLGDASQRQQSARALGLQVTSPSQVSDATMRLKLDTKKAVQALRRRSDVLSADLNYRRRAFAVPTDSYYGYQWDLPLISLPTAWDDTTRGSGAVVAVIDTGVLLNHPDLVGQVSADGGYDFISSPIISNDGDGIDPNPDDPGDKIPPETRSSFHGTHVAGTIAAVTCFSGDCPSGLGGIAGIAPHAKIMPLRVLGQGGGYDSDIIQAMYYAADLPNNSGTTPTARGGKKADIINMSLGGGSYSATFQSAVDQVRAQGVIVIAAAGNSSTSTPSYPAAYDGVVSVSAVGPGPSPTLAYYSNYGSTIDVTAPGGDQSINLDKGIYSTLGNDTSGSIIYTYDYYQGTSMAAPHVAGVAALMVPTYKLNHGGISMSPSEFDTYLSQGLLTDDISNDGATVRNNNYGYGLINANKALQATGVTLDIPPTMIPDKTAVDLGGLSPNISISVKNIAQGTYAGQTVDNVTATPDSSSSAWLSVGALSSSTISTSTPITFTISVSRSSVSDGYYIGAVTLHSTTAGVADVVITVSMYKGSIVGDAGYQYITLVNANTFLQVVQLPTSRNSITGSYSFSFSGVPNGEYFIVSGTDMDNDFIICDSGEACGVYPQVGTFTVNGGNVTGIQFNTGYFIPAGVAALSVNIATNMVIELKSEPVTGNR